MTIAQCTHPTLSLEQLRPDGKESYSPNLFAWVARRGYFRGAGIVTGIYRIKEGESYEGLPAGTLFIGYPVYENGIPTNFLGGRLDAVLSQGSQELAWCFLGVARVLEEVPNFWNLYLAQGRCAIDVAHVMSFAGDDLRYSYEGDKRTCRWCGATHERQVEHTIRVLETQTERWV